MNTTIQIDHFFPMSKKQTTTTTYETRKNYTDSQGVRIRESCIPLNRPTYKEWVKQMGINELAYQLNPAGRDRARDINEAMGLDTTPTVWEHITGDDVWHPERYGKQK